jgi:hypothetical protein
LKRTASRENYALNKIKKYEENVKKGDCCEENKLRIAYLEKVSSALAFIFSRQSILLCKLFVSSVKQMFSSFCSLNELFKSRKSLDVSFGTRLFVSHFGKVYIV